MKALLALGNPGSRYRDTRHNVGWWLADRLRSVWSFPPFREEGEAATTGGVRHGEPIRIVKPLTYVNRSGRGAAALAASASLRVDEDLLVLVDDVSLSPGTIRVRARGSSGGHNGLASVEQALQTREYARLRIGVGRPEDDGIDLADWVLAPMSDAEEEDVLEALDTAVDAVECWLQEGVEAAMNRFNAA